MNRSPIRYVFRADAEARTLACEQALWGALAAGREKEGELATTSLKFEYLYRKGRCEMVIGGDDIKLSFLFPPRRQSAPESLLAGLEYLMALPAQRKRLKQTNNTCPCKSNCAFLWRNVVAVPRRTNRHCDGSWFPCGLHHLYYPLCFFAVLKELRGEG